MNNTARNIQRKNDDSILANIDYQHLLRNILHYWWVFVITIGISYVCAYIVNRYSRPVYLANSIVLLHDNEKTRGISELTDGIALSSELSNINNQTFIYTSPMMVERVIRALDFQVTYYQKGHFIDLESYGESQIIRIIPDSTHQQPIGATFEANFISKDDIKLRMQAKHISGYSYIKNNFTGFEASNIDTTMTVRIGEAIQCKYFAFTIQPANEFYYNNPKTTITFNFNTIQSLISQWKSQISIGLREEGSTIANINCTGYNPNKIVAFLKALNEASISYNLEKKNAAAQRTLYFIQKQLMQTSDSLRSAANRVKKFKQEKGFASSSSYGTTLQASFFSNVQEVNSLGASRDFLSLIKRQLESGANIEDYFISGTATKENPLIQSQLQRLIEIQHNLNSTANETDNNPYRKKLKEQEQLLRDNIITLLSQNIEVCDGKIKELEKSNKQLISEASKLPELESEMLDLDREYKIQDAVYTFMLQKETETLIAKSSNVVDNEVLQQPCYVAQIAPNTKRNTSTALTIGFALPLAVLILLEIFNNKIRSVSELKRIVPEYKVIGSIPIFSGKEANDIPTINEPQGLQSEAFRSMRTRLRMILKGKQGNTLLFSSSDPGEGKTFTALNTAICFAYAGLKTIIINYDLRRPRLETIIKHYSGSKGWVNYLF